MGAIAIALGVGTFVFIKEPIRDRFAKISKHSKK
jgi:hypothetical protein